MVDIPGTSHQDKINLFVEIRQAFGRSALLLSGGGGLGIHHFGVIKTLHSHRLLPRIVSGSSVGSLVASLVCTSEDDELAELFSNSAPLLKNRSERVWIGLHCCFCFCLFCFRVWFCVCAFFLFVYLC